MELYESVKKDSQLQMEVRGEQLMTALTRIERVDDLRFVIGNLKMLVDRVVGVTNDLNQRIEGLEKEIAYQTAKKEEVEQIDFSDRDEEMRRDLDRAIEALVKKEAQLESAVNRRNEFSEIVSEILSEDLNSFEDLKKVAERVLNGMKLKGHINKREISQMMKVIGPEKLQAFLSGNFDINKLVVELDENVVRKVSAGNIGKMFSNVDIAIGVSLIFLILAYAIDTGYVYLDYLAAEQKLAEKVAENNKLVENYEARQRAEQKRRELVWGSSGAENNNAFAVSPFGFITDDFDSYPLADKEGFSITLEDAAYQGEVVFDIRLGEMVNLEGMMSPALIEATKVKMSRSVKDYLSGFDVQYLEDGSAVEVIQTQIGEKRLNVVGEITYYPEELIGSHVGSQETAEKVFVMRKAKVDLFIEDWDQRKGKYVSKTPPWQFDIEMPASYEIGE